jgi:hypothetical protein
MYLCVSGPYMISHLCVAGGPLFFTFIRLSMTPLDVIPAARMSWVLVPMVVLLGTHSFTALLEARASNQVYAEWSFSFGGCYSRVEVLPASHVRQIEHPDTLTTIVVIGSSK